jgi:hypothetical protein
MAIVFPISVPDIKDVLDLGYDTIAVYRSPTEDGTFVEITNPANRVALVANQTDYRFVDDSGENGDYYRIQYRSTSSALTSPISAAQIGSDPALTIVSVSELKRVYLAGLDLRDPQGNEFPDSFYAWYIRSAVNYIETELDSYLYPRDIEDERHDFIREDYYKWILSHLDHRPVQTVREMRLVLPTNQTIITYPTEWLNVSPNGRVQVVPGAGGMPAVALGLSAVWYPLLQGITNQIPHVFRFDYRAGYEIGRVPHTIRHLVGRVAAIGPLAIIGDLLFGPGVASNKIQLDSLLTNTESTKDPQNSAFSARLRLYRTEVQRELETMRRAERGMRMVVV